MPDWTVWERMQEHECSHEHTKPTKARKSNGVVCVYLQCADCGEKTKEDKKAKYDVDRLPWFDENFRERQRKRNQAIRDRLQEQYQAELQREQDAKNAEWWARYNGYLQSEHWAKLRRSVILRDGFRCQNCFRKVTEATAHAHHLSYTGLNRVGYSFAFECVTLCKHCHDEFHGKRETEDTSWISIPF